MPSIPSLNRSQAQLARKQQKRASYDRILIVSEGSKTEPLYFKEIRSAHRLSTTNVEVHPCQTGTQPLQVVHYARDLFLNGDPHKNIGKRAFEQVYAVFDRDEHRTYHEALSEAEQLNKSLRSVNKSPVLFRAIASVPSFELWLLLHYEDIHAPLHRDEVLRRLKKHIPSYEKGSGGHFAATRDKLQVATPRAQRLASLSDAYDGSAPYTDIFSLVEVLSKLQR